MPCASGAYWGATQMPRNIRGKRKPHQQAAQADELSGPAMTDVRAAQRQAKKAFGCEDTPRCDKRRGIGSFPPRESEGSRRRMPMTTSVDSSWLAPVGPPVSGLTGGYRSGSPQCKSAPARPAAGRAPRLLPARPFPLLLNNDNAKQTPEAEQRERKQYARVSGPVQKQFAAGVSAKPGERADGQCRRPHPEHGPAPIHRGSPSAP